MSRWWGWRGGRAVGGGAASVTTLLAFIVLISHRDPNMSMVAIKCNVIDEGVAAVVITCMLLLVVLLLF